MTGSKWLFAQREERARPDDEQLSATQAYGVILQKEFERKVGRKVTQIVQHLDKRRHVEIDDFVISMRSFQGGLERAWNAGAIRSSYVVLRPRAEVDVGYFARLFKCTEYISALQRTSNFIRDGQDLNFSNFSLVDLPVVPLHEQRAIARFLEHADRRIRKYVRAKQKLIKLLEEQKQAIIHQAVTRGLDPNVRMKPSGVEWLGDVPEHWEVKGLRHLASVIDGDRGPEYPNAGDLLDSGVPFLSSKCIRCGEVCVRDAPRISNDKFQRLRKGKLQRNDIVITVRGTIGAVGVFRGNESPTGFINAQMMILRADPARLLPDYFALMLRSPRVAALLAELAYGSAQKQLSNGILSALPLGLPPLGEQARIMRMVSSESSASTQDAARREVDLLREFRTRLISDVVTGKLDVRAAAAALPDVVEPDEPDVEESDDELDEDTDAADEETDE